jgi:hypothetical protein
MRQRHHHRVAAALTGPPTAPSRDTAEEFAIAVEESEFPVVEPPVVAVAPTAAEDAAGPRTACCWGRRTCCRPLIAWRDWLSRLESHCYWEATRGMAMRSWFIDGVGVVVLVLALALAAAGVYGALAIDNHQIEINKRSACLSQARLDQSRRGEKGGRTVLDGGTGEESRQRREPCSRERRERERVSQSQASGVKSVKSVKRVERRLKGDLEAWLSDS